MAVSLTRGYALGRCQYQSRTFHGTPMRVAQNLLDSVVFFGHGEGESFDPHGTGFLLIHKSLLYLVTAKHVAEGLGEDPFLIRANQVNGGCGLLHVDLVMEREPLLQWFGHEATSVDLAVIPFPIDVKAMQLQAVALLADGAVKQHMGDAGCGDMCHVIGLFAHRPGKSRNIAVVHTGHIAAMSDSKELIPTSSRGGSNSVEGYLVELSNLGGLSGAPVFVRGGLELDVPVGEGSRVVTVLTPDLKLLGVWQGSWNRAVVSAPQDTVSMGIVTPAHRLIELLDSGLVADNRREWLERQRAATLDSGA